MDIKFINFDNMKTNRYSLLAIAFIASTVKSFSVVDSSFKSRTVAGAASTSSLLAGLNESEEGLFASNRRNFIASTAVSTALPFISSKAQAADSNEEETSPTKGPVCIIGANGKTGSECVGNCISNSIPVRATSRSGNYSGVYASENLLSTAPCDVTNPSAISAAVKGSRAVVFAASASKQGGTAAAVDNDGLVNVAKACIEFNVPHLVIVSSGGVSKPDSPVYKFLNIFGKIMEEKIKGEDTVRGLYKGLDPSVCTYTIIRPGGLTEEPGMGVSALELNQGDIKSGRIARADVAALCIESTLYSKLTGGTTYECYDADTAKPLGGVGMSNIMKAKVKDDEAVIKTGKERRGDTFEQLFTGLSRD
jgi:uncharacterized protein YbjT (DUF2867 family)